MSEVKWIKIVTDIFDDEKTLLIEQMPEADTVIVIWFKMLCLAGKQNNGGVFMIADRIAYTDEMFATVFRRPVNTVRMALKTFQELGMIEIVNEAVTIPNWEKHQSLDKYEASKEASRIRSAKYREKQKMLAAQASSNVTSDVTHHVTVTENHAVEEIRLDKKRLDIDISDASASAPAKPTRHKYGQYQNVLLSDDDLEKLKNEFPNDWEMWIEKLSEGIAVRGYKYKNHLAAIRSWSRKEKGTATVVKAPAANPALNYAQREVKDEDYDGIFMNLDELETDS